MGSDLGRPEGPRHLVRSADGAVHCVDGFLEVLDGIDQGDALAVHVDSNLMAISLRPLPRELQRNVRQLTPSLDRTGLTVSG